MKLPWKSKSDDFKGFLDHGTSLTGELSFSGTFRVDGNIHGSIKTNDLLVVGELATIHADIKAGEVEIYGSVFGNIETSRRVAIYSTGRVRGDVRTPQLVLEDGGVFEGRSIGAGETETEGTAPDQEFGSRQPTEAFPPSKSKKDREWPDRSER